MALRRFPNPPDARMAIRIIRGVSWAHSPITDAENLTIKRKMLAGIGTFSSESLINLDNRDLRCGISLLAPGKSKQNLKLEFYRMHGRCFCDCMDVLDPELASFAKEEPLTCENLKCGEICIPFGAPRLVFGTM
jgi:hypothetical protein